ncbi:MAG: ROK family protein, partial [bacterium]|nr:ROK family protein [bacterium]
MKYALGVDLGGTNIKYMIIDNAGREIDHFENLTGANGGREVIMKNILAGIQSILYKHKDKKIQGIGIGSPGLIDAKGRVITGAA